jgi:hypothetical protein
MRCHGYASSRPEALFQGRQVTHGRYAAEL